LKNIFKLICLVTSRWPGAAPYLVGRGRPVAVLTALAALHLTGCARPAETSEMDCAATTAELQPLLDTRAHDITETGGIAQAWSAARRWVERHLVTHDDWVSLGSCQLREGDLQVAERAFLEARSRVRHSVDAAIGLGHVALRGDRPGEAALLFAGALKQATASLDAREGLRLALARLPVGDPAAPVVLDVLRAATAKGVADPADQYLLAMADRRSGGSGERRLRAEAPSGAVSYFARAGTDYLEVRDASGNWSPVFIQGVNLGPARPGRFASEAPEDEATWSGWLAQIADLGANAVRVYTLQPPAFYRALATHNEDSSRPRLWLLQGVWADLPPGDDFNDAAYVAGFEAGIARVIDAVHGDLVLDPVRGHARGVFDVDVSAFTLGWIIGREWEPFAVAAFQQLNPAPCTHDGRLVQVRDGQAMECWIGRMLDYAAGYEARRHGQARPLTFANWPTLDPISHSTEATRAEEDRIRLQVDDIPLPARTAPAWDDDAVSVDATRMTGTPAFPPGVFASYHVYPNFPYFMNLEPAYAEAHDDEGVLRYAGYLRELKAHHGRQPVMVAEFGMSTSRGIAHLQPEGLHHGGHDEAEAMHQNARLIRAIHAERMAGGVAFEFMDEWFKGTWSTSPFEIPEEHRPRWFNAESPEQSYGLFAMRPAQPVRVDGDASDWSSIAPLATEQAQAAAAAPMSPLKAAYDAGWVYLLLQSTGGVAPDWTRIALSIGFDTYDAARGERRLPAPADCEVPGGVEFALVLRGPDASELLVTPPYLLRHPAESGDALQLYSPTDATGSYSALSLETNRERYTRAGLRIPAQRVSPGKLRFGSLDPAAPDFDSRSDVSTGSDGTIELRLPWALLNFADPSTASVLHNPEGGAQIGTMTTTGIGLHVCVRDLGSRSTPMSLPPAFLPVTPWTQPEFVMQPKHGLDELRDAFRTLAGTPLARRPETEHQP